ncbi:MAG: MoxR family ATPase [Gammaproteobacteria bacterium]|nr:MoxR family ATPase [Gammaproteobacteria bacterium]
MANSNEPLSEDLDHWRKLALSMEEQIGKVVVGQSRAIRLITVAVFSRGHVLLEGDVGVGKTTLLRAVSRAVGGEIERIEGTVDLLPSDLVYHTYISEEGKPVVNPGPILKHGERLSIFFFNEINRARPQVHSMMLRVMAERSVTAFNTDYYMPHLQVFADRNRMERDETYEIPAAARDRFMMEFSIGLPKDPELQLALMTDVRFHDADTLIESVAENILDFKKLNAISGLIQNQVHVSRKVQEYALSLCSASREPELYSISVSDVDVSRLIQSGASPRGMSMLLKAARVRAWLEGREIVLPEDIRDLFADCMKHRIFFTPVYEMRRTEIADAFVDSMISTISSP